MKTSSFTVPSIIAASLLVAALSAPGRSLAQGNSTGPINNSITQMDGRQANKDVTEEYLREQLGDPKEEAAYQAFHKASDQDPDKKIHLGIAFLAKYQKDRYSQAVYEELSQTYYNKKDLPSFYTYSEKGLSLFPDDVHLLALSGWVAPRAFDSHDPDADKKLDKAESYEKHALDVLGTLVKPEGVTDEQFAQFKTGESAVAHSGLGMIFFRREQYEQSVKELEIATKNQATPDSTDYFILGADLENLGRYKDAAEAFNRCAQMPGAMQENCKKYSADATQRAANSQ